MANGVSVEVDVIAGKILIIRGKKVMLDRDLAQLYGVETRILNQAVKRNIARFPEDFMFSLTRDEIMRISQIVISLKFSKTAYAFTQEGVAMLSGVLNSEKAVQVNIQIMRAFVKLRYILSANKHLEMKMKEIEDKLGTHDKDIRDIFAAIRQLMGLPGEKRKVEGFRAK